ncbi:type II toxin-antitoxin system PemK/MazF family toxin [Ferrimicrobium acidiphilum]
MQRESVINCDGIHTISQALMTGPIGKVDDDVMARVEARRIC